MIKKIFIILFLILPLAACAPKGMLRYPPGKWLISDDRTPIAKPKSRFTYSPSTSSYDYVYDGVDIFINTTDQISQTTEKLAIGGKQEALNVNNFDEVPDSTWYTNRLGRYNMSPDEIAKPSDPKLAPRIDGKIKVLSANTLGGNPIMYVEDENDRRYILRFEPPNGSGLTTGSELISSSILKAAGYNVPLSYIVGIDTSNLKLGHQPITWGKYSVQRTMTDEDLKKLIDEIRNLGDGALKVRALATMFPSGEPLGPFSFDGRRDRDPNDLIPHEHRRELRGYRVFSSLINNMIIGKNGTLDTFHRSEGALGYIKHNIFNLSTAFGRPRSWDGKPTPKKGPNEKRKKEYDYGYGNAAITMFTLGIYKPPAEHRNCNDSWKGTPFLSTCRFNPGKWITKRPNDAFLYMTDRDGFWAARIIMKISDKSIHKLVTLAELRDPKLEEYIQTQLIARRDAIGRYWFSEINPLDEFRVENSPMGATIHFDDLAITHGFAKQVERQYRFMIQTRFDTATLLPWSPCNDRRVKITKPVIEKLTPKRVYTLRLQTIQDGAKWPMPSIDLYIEKNGRGEIKIVGINRRSSH